jgi:hypothetical protein
MFRALLAHPQEAQHKRHLGTLCACYVSWLLLGLEWNWCRYIFRALLAHPQEDLHERQLGVLCACHVSWLLSGL